MCFLCTKSTEKKKTLIMFPSSNLYKLHKSIVYIHGKPIRQVFESLDWSTVAFCILIFLYRLMIALLVSCHSKHSVVFVSSHNPKNSNLNKCFYLFKDTFIQSSIQIRSNLSFDNLFTDLECNQPCNKQDHIQSFSQYCKITSFGFASVL